SAATATAASSFASSRPWRPPGTTAKPDAVPVCLGLDYGLRRIGIAAGDTERRLAFAVTTHVEGRDGPVLALLRRLVAERGVALLVVGLPLTADGREAALAAHARRFAAVLERELGLPAVLW